MPVLFYSDFIQPLITCLVIAVASSSISITVTQTELFVPFREWVKKLGHMTGYLFRCFYCLSHWVVIIAMVVYHPRLIQSQYVLVDWVVTAFFTITLSAFISGLMFKVFLSAMAKAKTEAEMKAAAAKNPPAEINARVSEK